MGARHIGRHAHDEHRRLVRTSEIATGERRRSLAGFADLYA
jgi:hypothetical protein